MADILTTGPVTALELLAISDLAPPEIAARIRRAADQLAGFACPSSGAMRIVAERVRHVREEGFHALADDAYKSQHLAMAAACYALPVISATRAVAILHDRSPEGWPWPRVAWKPGHVQHIGDSFLSMAIPDRIRELEKAGALCAAEIDRLVRLQAEGVEFV